MNIKFENESNFNPKTGKWVLRQSFQVKNIEREKSINKSVKSQEILTNPIIACMAEKIAAANTILPAPISRSFSSRRPFRSISEPQYKQNRLSSETVDLQFPHIIASLRCFPF